MSKSVDLVNIFVLEIFSLFCKVALKILVLLLKNRKRPVSEPPLYVTF